MNEPPNHDELKKSEHDALYRRLYLVCRAATDPSWQDDKEAVTALRDHETYTKYNRNYRELNEVELREMIAEIESRGVEFASPYQLKLLRWYAISVALVYCRLDDWFSIDGDIVNGEDCRNFWLNAYSENQPLPRPVIRHLFERWINPKVNEYLVQGKFKKYCRKPDMCHFEKLTKKEATYLISRFKQFYNECKNKAQEFEPDFQQN